MDVYVQASSGPFSIKIVTPKVIRRSANYHPSVWGDHFLSYASDLTKIKSTKEEELIRELKEEVKKMLVDLADMPSQQLKLIDDIQRLGVSYHLESEIDAALHHIYDSNNYLDHKDEYEVELHNVALRFRLLRQQGYKISSENAFRKFLDEEGKFKETLITDERGMLSLYEAAHLRVHGEDILDQALAFTTTHLESMTSRQVVHALKQPIRMGLTRVEARHYISIYQQDDLHNKELLKFAKLDFNLLQKAHQRELGYVTKWWKDLNFAKKLPFARDRMVECYFWILGVYFEPQYFLARRILTKVIAMTSIIDDIYDVYGTLEELILFTDAIERWDISALDQLPEYMGLCYKALLDVYTEMEEELAKEERSYRVHYAKAAMKKLVRAYMDEANWFHEGYVPTMEEYMEVALVSGAYIMLATTSFVGLGDLATKEAFDWVSSNPLMVRASSVICRLTDDMVGHEFEQERGHVASAVECYMKQHGASKKEVFAEFNKRITNAWQDINQECLYPIAIPMPFLMRVLNLARVINLLYKEEDGYTHSKTKIKDLIASNLVDSVPI